MYAYTLTLWQALAAAADAAANGDIGEIERVFAEARDVIIGKAAIGAINVNGAVLSALKGIKFDHQHGTVEIGNSVVSSDVLVTGGGPGAKKCFCVSNP